VTRHRDRLEHVTVEWRPMREDEFAAWYEENAVAMSKTLR